MRRCLGIHQSAFHRKRLNAETGKGEAQSQPNRLAVGLFGGPNPKKPLLHRVPAGLYVRNLLRMKKMPRKGKGLHHSGRALDVQSNAPRMGKGGQDTVPGMGDAKGGT